MMWCNTSRGLILSRPVAIWSTLRSLLEGSAVLPLVLTLITKLCRLWVALSVYAISSLLPWIVSRSILLLQFHVWKNSSPLAHTIHPRWVLISPIGVLLLCIFIISGGCASLGTLDSLRRAPINILKALIGILVSLEDMLMWLHRLEIIIEAATRLMALIAMTRLIIAGKIAHICSIWLSSSITTRYRRNIIVLVRSRLWLDKQRKSVRSLLKPSRWSLWYLHHRMQLC